MGLVRKVERFTIFFAGPVVVKDTFVVVAVIVL